MPIQDEHDEPENLVDAPGEAAKAARTLGQAADSNATLEGYYAINNRRPGEEADTPDDPNREQGHPVP